MLKWRSKATRKAYVHRSVYWCDQYRARNLFLYWKSATRLRLELRFKSARAVRRAGLGDVARLHEVNPAAIFEHNVALLDWRPAYLRRLTRNSRARAVPHDRIKHVVNSIDMQSAVPHGLARCAEVPFIIPSAVVEVTETSTILNSPVKSTNPIRETGLRM